MLGAPNLSAYNAANVEQRVTRREDVGSQATAARRAVTMKCRCGCSRWPASSDAEPMASSHRPSSVRTIVHVMRGDCATPERVDPYCSAVRYAQMATVISSIRADHGAGLVDSTLSPNIARNAHIAYIMR